MRVVLLIPLPGVAAVVGQVDSVPALLAEGQVALVGDLLALRRRHQAGEGKAVSACGERPFGYPRCRGNW
ncbi:MAG TPA: hypothetical protein VIO61_14905 [Anaerolineaceae bacterium]